MTTFPFNPAEDGAQMAFDGRMSYGDYLQIDRILSAQHPLSDAHDEMLFIIQHQTSELWMKLAIHEITSAMQAIRADDLQPAFKMLTRVARIFEQLNQRYGWWGLALLEAIVRLADIQGAEESEVPTMPPFELPEQSASSLNLIVNWPAALARR